MGVFENLKLAPEYANAKSKEAAAGADDWEQAEVYANIGYTSAGGEAGDTTFIAIPKGIAIDTQKKAKRFGNNEGMNQITDSKNDLLEQLQLLAANLAPGESIIVGQLSIELRRRKATEKADPAANPHMTALQMLNLLGNR